MRILQVLIIFLLTGSFAQGQMPVITIAAGAASRSQTPVQVALRKALPVHQQYQVINQLTGHVAPAQLLDSVTLVFILPDSLPAGSKKRYLLKAVAGAQKKGVRIIKNEAGYLVQLANKPILQYDATEVFPPNDSAYYRRSGFIHPLYSPSGKILTDDFPAGHAHQHAIFTAWTNTTYRGQFTDFWNQHLKKGTVEHVEVLKVTEGPVVSELQVALQHKSLQFGPVLREVWTLRFYPFRHYYLFDLISDQQNITEDTLYLNQYHYGGLAFRGNRAWNPVDKAHYKNDWHIVTSEGIRDSLANHTHARWVDAYGLVNGQTAGAAVLSHPANFRYPQAIRVHPTMPYWVYSPVIDGAFTLDPGIPYHAQYRYFVHDGEAGHAVIEKLAQDWTTPPAVTIRYATRRTP